MQNPRLSAELSERLYSEHAYHSYSDGRLSETLAYALRRPEPLMRYIEAAAPVSRNPGVVIDVGCGLGGALLGYKLRGWDAHGIEPDPSLAGVATGLGLDVRTEFFSADSFDSEYADLVYTCHSFEHFVDPLAVARSAHSTLKQDGLLFVCVPTFRKARLSGRQWMNVAHTFMFTDRTLGNLLFRAGFERVAHRYHAAEGELWFLARKGSLPAAAGPLPDPEDWRRVSRELAIWMPARTAAWWAPQRLARNAHHLGTLALDPAEFGRKVLVRIAGRRSGRLSRKGAE
jgi:SAM-dependent methyltransferase